MFEIEHMELKRNNELDQRNRLQGFDIRYVKWAPVGNALVYVDYDNNIYYRRSAMSQDDKLTDNGVANEVSTVAI